MNGTWRLVRWVGLGLVAGAVLQGRADAQDTTRARRDTTRVIRPEVRVPIPPGPDTIVKRDSTPERDSLVAARLARLAADTVKAPLARAELPELVDVTRPLMRWDRAGLFATGAFTLLDLLERIPGLTALRVGWVGAPMIGAYLGNMQRIRVFFDGLEIDPLDPRTGGAIDLGTIQLWTAEELRIERGADEIRVYVRSWRVQRTTPYTRADVATGDQETNLYRGFFGRRFQRGEALQVAAQQFSTTPTRLSEGTHQASLMARVGWAKGRLSVDGTVLRGSPDRGVVLSNPGLSDGTPVRDTVLALTPRETFGYLRVGWGDPEAGPWAQVIAGGQEHRFTGVPAPPEPTPDPNAPRLSPDTTRYEGQYVLTGGLSWRGLRLSATERLRAFEGRREHSPSVRASFASAMLATSVFAELEGATSDAHAEASVRVTPLSFVSVGGAVSARTGDGAGVTLPALRAEGAVRVGELWFGGGLLRRDATPLAAPIVFSRRYEPREDGPATGAFATLRGRIWGPFYADLVGTRWNDLGGLYRPQYQTRSEVYVTTTLPRRFPSGNFGLFASLVHEYRSDTFFPIEEDGADRAGGFRILTGLVEVRILQAVLTYQYRNLLIENFVTVPNFFMPRQTQFYGVRWEFWN